MKLNNNPIVQEVKDKYLTIEKMTSIFVNNPNAAMRGLLISGDAGFGKTHYTRKGLAGIDQSRIDYVKGSSITPAVMFVKLYQNSNPGDILILDDVDIAHKSTADRNTILDLFKGATEPTKGERTLEWGRAQRNQMMVDNDVPQIFNFEGAVIWITNDTIETLADKCKSHWNAISSRFRQIPVWLNEQEKLMYTLHLVEEVGMLGVECQAKEGGYPQDIVDRAAEYIRNNYRFIDDISPRVAIAIADTIDNFSEEWKTYCDYQFINIK